LTQTGKYHKKYNTIQNPQKIQNKKQNNFFSIHIQPIERKYTLYPTLYPHTPHKNITHFSNHHSFLDSLYHIPYHTIYYTLYHTIYNTLYYTLYHTLYNTLYNTIYPIPHIIPPYPHKNITHFSNHHSFLDSL
jgi:hypothetical protein